MRLVERHDDVELLAFHAERAELLGEPRNQLAEGGKADALFGEIRPQAQQHALDLAGEHLPAVALLEDGHDQVVHIRQRQRLDLLPLRALLAAGDAFQELELAAGVHKYAAGRLASGNAQHKLAHRFQLADERHIVAVAGNDAEAVNQRIGVGHVQRVDDELNIQAVLLVAPEPERGHDREGVGQQNLLEVGIAVRIAVNLADEDVAANLYPLDHVHQHALFAAAVFKIDKQRKMRSHQTHPFVQSPSVSSPLTKSPMPEESFIIRLKIRALSASSATTGR